MPKRENKNGYLFDDNALKLVFTGDENTAKRIQEHEDSIFLSSVAAEEWLVGYMAGINRARTARNALSLPRAHEDFARAIEDIRYFPLFIYSPEAEAIYQTFSPATLRIGPQDCRIAAQALAHGMIVVTRNLRDFEAIGALCEDWSAA